MKVAILLLAATALGAQAPAQQTKQPTAPRDGIPASHGDDTRGYNDTPQLPNQKWKVHDMERPRAAKVTPGPLTNAAPPSDAIVLFDGKDLSHWMQMARGGQAQEPKWKVENGYLEIVPRTGRLVTKEKFGDCQLHVEWMIPKEATGSGQGRGNSGVELMTRYEIQVLESSENLTYADGAAGAMYGVWPPLVNPARPQGEWNVYDILFEAPRFADGKLVKPAYFTVLFNGVLVHNHREQLGTTIWRQVGKYTPHAAEEPLSLQDHSQPVRYRNIWIRRLAGSDLPTEPTVRDEVEKIRSGRYAPMPPAQTTVSAPVVSGRTTMTVRNSTAHELSVFFDGPVSQKLTLAPGSSQDLDLAPGTFHVAGRVAAANALPFYGEETYASSTRYSITFYIAP